MLDKLLPVIFASGNCYSIAYIKHSVQLNNFRKEKMIPEIFLTAAVEESVKFIYNQFSTFIQNGTIQVKIADKKLIKESLEKHKDSAVKWANEVIFADLRTAKLTSKIFVTIDILLLPSRLLMDGETNLKISLADLLNHTPKHISLLGQPGAGKTTSMKFLSLNFLNRATDTKNNSMPYVFLIKFRDIEYTNYKKDIIANSLADIFSLKVEVKNKDDDNKNLVEKLKSQFIIKLLNEFNGLLVLDGFDEIPTIALKEEVVKELRGLFTSINKTKIIITSRTAEFNYAFENVDQYEIAPLNEQQIRLFAEKWLCDSLLAEKLIDDISKSPFSDTAIRPINLAHLCAIFERTGSIPDKPKTVYKKIVNLLLEEWDEQRGIRRNSIYSNFEIDRKFDFLSALAFELSSSSESHNLSFNTEDLKHAYNNIYLDFGLEKNQRDIVIKEIESHTGLFVESGYDKFEFSHKSIQEYLTAYYLVRLSSIPYDIELTISLLNEFAIAVAIASRPSEYLTEFIHTRVYNRNDSSVYRGNKHKPLVRIIPIEIFVNRLLLEKPDFNYSQQLGVTFLVLYTKYMESVYFSGRQLSLFTVNTLTVDFEKFFNIIIPRVSFDSIISNYDFDKEIRSGTDISINRFLLKDIVDPYIRGRKGSKDLKLPEYILINPNIIS